jgi:hypothetical protein
MNLLGLVGLLAVVGAAPAAATIFGTMSNYDVYNSTGEDAYGCEIELEGVHKSEILGTFPAHYVNEIVTEYVNGATYGTRIIYSGYNFNSSGFLATTFNPSSTNGHQCVGTPGCEHFGFSVASAQPTAARHYWLNAQDQRINANPVAIPSPTWTYVPPANPGDAPRLAADVDVPENEVEVQRPDSIWMKVYKTEINRPVDVLELMSGDDVVPEDESETESEWELLEGGKMAQFDDDVAEDSKSVIRRFEYYAYTGAYDAEHEPLSEFLTGNLAEPPAGELGDFIAANMVAANLEVPAVALQGDYNADGQVDGADLLEWQKQVGRNDFPSADLDHDGVVGGDDLAHWEHGLEFHNDLPGDGAVAAAGAAVPEATSALLALFAAAGASGACRRRG